MRTMKRQLISENHLLNGFVKFLELGLFIISTVFDWLFFHKTLIGY
jgi:hypothetical protein